MTETQIINHIRYSPLNRQFHRLAIAERREVLSRLVALGDVSEKVLREVIKRVRRES